MNLNKLKIHTPEISKLKNLVETSQIWIEEAKSTIDCEVDLAKMNKLLYEARKINVNLDLYDTIKERQNLANTLINKIEITNVAADGKKTRSKHLEFTCLTSKRKSRSPLSVQSALLINKATINKKN